MQGRHELKVVLNGVETQEELDEIALEIMDAIDKADSVSAPDFNSSSGDLDDE